MGLIEKVALPPGFLWDFGLVFNKETMRLSANAGHPYLFEPSDIEENPLQFTIDEDQLAIRFPILGIRRESDGTLAAYISLSMVTMDVDGPTLPDDGWSALVPASYTNETPTAMALWVALVDSSFRGLGLSEALLLQAKLFAKAKGFRTLIAPVRPTHKSARPDLDFASYISATTPEGEALDPWLRAHISAGAEVLNVWSRSVVVRASTARWTKWTLRPFAAAGAHEIPGGLASLQISDDLKSGVYVEPNIWVRYRL